uniref:Secreted protein n=1 Tax=Globodera rostochiensis TaxID=31243 RepID=A0A914HA83_GLORO
MRSPRPACFCCVCPRIELPQAADEANKQTTTQHTPTTWRGPPAVSVPSSSPAVEQKHRGMDALFCCVQLGDPSSTWWWLKTFRERDI